MLPLIAAASRCTGLGDLSLVLRPSRTGPKSERPPDPVVLNEFRHTIDNVRLTAWSVSELVNAEHIKKNPDTVLAFLSAERLRRFDQLVKNLCGDIERGLITVQTNGLQSLWDSVNNLQRRIAQLAKHRMAFKVKDAAS